METKYTPKALAALQMIAEGETDNVTRQMIDRLSAERLIDFDPRNGWFVTEYGWNFV